MAISNRIKKLEKKIGEAGLRYEVALDDYDVMKAYIQVSRYGKVIGRMDYDSAEAKKLERLGRIEPFKLVLGDDSDP
ncbi:MAG: hypothetical protein Q7S09_05620 [bacterium]|nr:hypothetical protein [bacterium]